MIVCWISFIWFFWAGLGKMPVLMTIFAFKGDLLIVNCLEMIPSFNGKIDGFRETFLQIDLHTNSSTGKHRGFRFQFVNTFTQGIPYCAKILIISTMEGEAGKLEPN